MGSDRIQRQVQFSDVTLVRTVPGRTDIGTKFEEIWYCQRNYDEFKKEIVEVLVSIISQHPKVESARQAFEIYLLGIDLSNILDTKAYAPAMNSIFEFDNSKNSYSNSNETPISSA